MPTESESVSKLQILRSRFAASQFVLDLNPQSLVPVDLAAAAIGKSSSTFRSDLVRRPDCLPRITRRGHRVLVRVSDLLDWLNNGPPADPNKRRVGRPTKAEQLARAAAAASGGAQ